MKFAISSPRNNNNNNNNNTSSSNSGNNSNSSSPLSQGLAGHDENDASRLLNFLPANNNYVSSPRASPARKPTHTSITRDAELLLSSRNTTTTSDKQQHNNTAASHNNNSNNNTTTIDNRGNSNSNNTNTAASSSASSSRDNNNNQPALLAVVSNSNTHNSMHHDSSPQSHYQQQQQQSSSSNNRNDDNNFHRERKEDDPTTHSNNNSKPTSESGRSRGATPPRPAIHGRSRSNDGIPNNNSTRNRSASPNNRPNRIPRVPTTMKSGNSNGNGHSNTSAAAAVADGTSSQTSSPRNPRGNHSIASSTNNTGGGNKASASSSARRFSAGNSNSNNWQVSAAAAPPQQQQHKADPTDHEQTLFEQRLCEDSYGVAVRKISQTGKPNLRYVKCLTIDPTATSSDQDTLGDSSNHNNPPPAAASARSSVSSMARRSFRKSTSLSSVTSNNNNSSNTNINNGQQQQPSLLSAPRIRVLTWGKKKDVRLPLDRFVCVQKGKTTERARRNASPACRILSLVTSDPTMSLDIEAPTRLDRDKFARAFARFLDVPLMGEDKTAQSVSSAPRSEPSIRSAKQGRKSTATRSEPDLAQTPKQAIADNAKRIQQLQQQQQHDEKAPFAVLRTNSKNPLNSNNNALEDGPQSSSSRNEQQQLRNSLSSSQNNNINNNNPMMDNSSHSPTTPKQFHDNHQKVQIASLPGSLQKTERSSTQAATASRPTHEDDTDHAEGGDGDDASQVSSLTGAGFDQEIVEELHQALTELKTELEESRAEAARAVKVAEQAIQSAENSSSNDWNSTVTHKAAEAAALAQKKSAEAMAKQRLAEERLDGERRTGAFWRRQAESSEEEAGVLQTRAAAAEVQRAAMTEEVECERRKAASMVASIKARYATTEKNQKDALKVALDRNRSLEFELDGTRRDLVAKNDEAKTLEENLSLSNTTEVARSTGNRMKMNIMGRSKKRINQAENDLGASVKLLPRTSRSSSDIVEVQESVSSDSNVAGNVFKLQAETAEVRKHFELLRKTTADELQRLPEDAKLWSDQVSATMNEAQSEIVLLREKLALESAARRKLLHEVQDLRGVVRVYCRPSESQQGVKSMLSIPSQETLLLHPYENESPMSFKFDRVFTPDVQQREIYNEVEELCLSVMDGYNICLMAHGQRGTGKTYSMLGDVKYSGGDKAGEAVNVDIEDFGIHLQAAKQLFSIADHRSDRYQDVFTLEIVEVYNERLIDLLAGTDLGERCGQIVMEDSKSSSRRSKRGMSDDGSSLIHYSNSHSVSSKQGSTMTKLEIRTNHNGDTVVQGLLQVEVSSFDDVYKLWQECLSHRATRLAELGIDFGDYEASSHVIATLTVTSMNVSTGMGSIGKIKFVDLAGADLVQRRGGGSVSANPMKCPTPDSSVEKGGNNDWKYSNRSLATLNDVVNCRSQYMRSVPYRNSTLTHLLRDNLEADTKVLLLLCVSGHQKDLQETACALRFAAGMRRVTIGKPTKHSINR